MLNNEQSHKSWIQRVDEYEGEPGDDTMSDEEAWARLQQRYPKKTKPIRRYIYWAAAALVLFMLIPLLTRFMRQDSPQVPRDIVEKPAPKPKTNPGTNLKDSFFIRPKKDFIENAGYEPKDKGSGKGTEDEFHPQRQDNDTSPILIQKD